MPTLDSACVFFRHRVPHRQRDLLPPRAFAFELDHLPHSDPADGLAAAEWSWGPGGGLGGGVCSRSWGRWSLLEWIRQQFHLFYAFKLIQYHAFGQAFMTFLKFRPWKPEQILVMNVHLDAQRPEYRISQLTKALQKMSMVRSNLWRRRVAHLKTSHHRFSR